MKSETVQRDQQLETTAALSLSNLLHQACVNARTKQSRYPVALYGEFCTVETTNPIFEYFEKELEQALSKDSIYWASVYLTAMGNLGHPKTTYVVQKVLDRVENPEIKSKAIFALKNVIVSRSSENLPSESVNKVDRIAR